VELCKQQLMRSTLLLLELSSKMICPTDTAQIWVGGVGQDDMTAFWVDVFRESRDVHPGNQHTSGAPFKLQPGVWFRAVMSSE
jgi:hypothetical protein